MERKLPGLLRMLEVDYPIFAGIGFPLTFWMIYIILLLLGRPYPPLLIVETAITAFGLAIVFWRYQAIRSTFAHGIESTGVIKHISYWRYLLPSRGKVVFTYPHNGREVTTSTPIHRGHRTLSLKVGDKVKIIADPNAPIKAFIKDLYL